MADEVELKLALPAEAQRAFLRHPLLKHAVARKTERLINLYYDTPDQALRKRGIALRLRRQGRQWLQTVKCAGSSAAGLSTRPEWETPYGGRFDFSAVDAADVRHWLGRRLIRDHLSPLFETSFHRRTWRFEPEPGVALLLTLDRGWIAAAGRREAISELEIEVERGEPHHVFALARAIAERVCLAPALLSKAERGYRLFHGTRMMPAKAEEDFALDGTMAPLEGFQRIALSCLDHLQYNHAGAVDSDDPEYIHQMRVATRRLRAALRLFAPLLSADVAGTLLPPLRAQMRLLGAARDMDVLLDEIAAPVMNSLAADPRLAALVGLVTERRFRHRDAAKETLRSAAFGQFVLLAGDLLHGTALREPVTAGETLANFAVRRIRRLHKKVRRLAAAASVADPTSLHALRIGIKRLRYALEFFGPLARRKQHRAGIAKLAALQDALGQINDLANAGRLLNECAGEDPRLREAVTLIGGWHAVRYATLLESIPHGVRQLHKLRLPKLLSSPSNRESV